MAKNKITDLRDHLFETIEMLKDDENKTMSTVKTNGFGFMITLSRWRSIHRNRI